MTEALSNVRFDFDVMYGGRCSSSWIPVIGSQRFALDIVSTAGGPAVRLATEGQPDLYVPMAKVKQFTVAQ